MITPIRYGAEIRVGCVTGYQKISGPDAVTCIESTTFYGLDDVYCLGKYTILFSFRRMFPFIVFLTF